MNHTQQISTDIKSDTTTIPTQEQESEAEPLEVATKDTFFVKTPESAEASFTLSHTGAEGKVKVPEASADKLINGMGELATLAATPVGILAIIKYAKGSGMPAGILSAAVLVLASALATIVVARTLRRTTR
ncbi:hypothetical protein ACIG0C_36700 [Kitasatospora aureofaciens]|uniref:Uncharacterized protein n=1 Tax=Kitasatospora aureofaciens TaxID=1894 RepID=A0A1E7NAR2_KITAU|nr:hypothetical protein [Kitasatospora aureofaciens]ARF78093.1 hypothetical protein B6264_03425 [Kitasatospora aureofaciens]OEV37772.1 hypothetical protein HS99_0024575 [Kitasatospora aureofaciens]GGV08430.1 hypothetical protein GCM10010502_74210 [Kitasatospora aureofaciens]